MEQRNFINGKFIESISKIDITVLNPANQKVVGNIDQALDEEINLAYESAKKAFNKRIGSMLAEKWKSPYSAVMGFVNARVSIAILRATHLCLRGSRVPYRHISTKRSDWDDGAGLGMFQTTS